MKFNFKMNLKVSALYLEKQKSFIHFFKPLSISKQKIFVYWLNFLANFDAFFNGFWFCSILAGWSIWQWVFLNFSQNFWSFDTPGTPGCVSAVIWNRFEPFLLRCNCTLWLVATFSFCYEIWMKCWWYPDNIGLIRKTTRTYLSTLILDKNGFWSKEKKMIPFLLHECYSTLEYNLESPITGGVLSH